MSNAFEVAGFKPGVLKAGADLSSAQFLGVKLNNAGDVVLAGDGDLSIGVLQNKPILGEACEIEFDGLSKAVSGAAVANAGTKLATNAAGKYIAAVSTKHVVAVNLTPSGALDELFTVAVIGLKGHILA